MNIINEIQKLAVRMTTAENKVAVKGSNIAEALGFLADNLNVDANGKLLVKEYKEPVEPGEPSGDPLIVLDNYSTEMGGFMLVNETPIDLGGYEDTDVQIVYSVNDGEKKTFNALMRIIENSPVIMEITESGAGPCLLEGTMESGLLFACYLNMNANTMGEGSSTMVQPTGDYAYPNTSKVTIWSIEKVAASKIIEVTESNFEMDGMACFKQEVTTVGIKANKTYKVTYTYDGVQYEEICVPMENKYDEGTGFVLSGTLEDGSRSEFSLSFGNTIAMICDKMRITDTMDFEYNETIASIFAAPQDGENQMSLPFSIDNIAEYVTEAPVNLLDVGPLTWTDSGDLVYISAMELEDGKSYKLEGVFGSNATPYSVTATAYDYAKAASDDLESAGVTNEALTAEIEAARGIILLEADVVTDEEAYQNQGSGYMAVSVINHGAEGEGDMYDYNASSLTLSLGYSAAGDAYPFVLNSITEVESTDEPSEPVNPGPIVTFSESDYDNYGGGYLKTFDVPVDTSAFENNEKVKVNVIINGEPMSVEAYMYKENDVVLTYGGTIPYLEYLSTDTPDSLNKGKSFFIIPYTDGSTQNMNVENYLNKCIYDGMTDSGFGTINKDGATFRLNYGGYDQFPIVEISSIEKI